jgi:hypothetical protein
MKATGWEGTADKILELHRVGPGPAPAARVAVAEPPVAQSEGERILGLIHGAGPGKLAPKCIGCLGRTTACGAACDNDPGCQYSRLATVRKLQELLDREWVAAVRAKTPGANKFG